MAADAAIVAAQRRLVETLIVGEGVITMPSPFQQQNVATAQSNQLNDWVQPGSEAWLNQRNTLQQQAFEAANQRNATLLSGMPVPTPVSHVKQQADAMLAALQAKIDALEAAAAARDDRLEAAEAALEVADREISRFNRPAASVPERSPFVNALATWPGRGGVDQWSGMPVFVGRSVK